jgi:hypothetical protein
VKDLHRQAKQAAAVGAIFIATRHFPPIAFNNADCRFSAFQLLTTMQA